MMLSWEEEVNKMPSYLANVRKMHSREGKMNKECQNLLYQHQDESSADADEQRQSKGKGKST